MQSVLVCVRSPLAAKAVSNAAEQLGLSDVVATAVSGSDALARVAQAPADVVLVDTASVRPDTVGFTRRMLERSPEAVVVFFGPEEPTVAQSAVAAGARGLIRGGEREDLVASVAKALMLVLRGPRASLPAQPVPLQRSDRLEVGEAGRNARVTAAGEAVEAGGGRPEASAADRPGRAVPAAGGMAFGGMRRLALTERELQVLRGMADGKSNAEIGRDLFVSEDTVKTHARRLFRKLGARDRAHAVAAAFRAGLVR
ncbi:MAG TPA: response regulator transcription factor [Micromonosporaceae bacterium]